MSICRGRASWPHSSANRLPRVIPIGFLWNGAAIVVCTAVTAPKVKALGERPNVALTIDTIGPPAKALLVRGVANVEIVDGVAPEYLAAAAKSTHGDELAAFEAQVRALYKQMARTTIAPTWARFYTSAPAGSRPSCVDWSTPLPSERRSTRKRKTIIRVRR